MFPFVFLTACIFHNLVFFFENEKKNFFRPEKEALTAP